MKHLFNDYVQDLETYIMFLIKAETLRLTPELIAKNRAPIALDMGAPTAKPPQFVIDKLKEALDMDGLHSYSTPKGEAYLMDAIAQRMKAKFGVDVCAKSEIFSLIGSKEGLANIIRELINPKNGEFEKDIVLIPDPGYASYKEMVKVSGGVAYSVPLTKENSYMPDLEIVVEQLEKEGYDKKKVKALIINYPNNPLGASATREYLQKAVDFCKKMGILLISDAAYIDMSLDGDYKPASILEMEGAKEVAVEFFSFSKPYAMTGWRMGWVCGSAEVIAMFGKMKSTIDTGLFKAMQKAGSQVLNSKEGDEYIEQATIGFKRKQGILVKGLAELGWDMTSLPNATFYLWLPIPPRYNTSKEFTDDLLKTSGVVMVPGDAFGKYGQGWFRISIVCSDEQLVEVIDRMKTDGFYFNK